MSKVIKVKIGDHEYKLQSDKEELTLNAAELVNEQIELVAAAHNGKLPQQKLSDIVALNLAELVLSEQNYMDAELDRLNKKLNEMSDYLERVLTSKDIPQ